MVKTPSKLAKANEAVTRAIRIGMAKADIKNYTELAKKIGVPKSTFYEHIKTPLDMPMSTLYLISVAVKTPFAELVGDVNI